MPRAELRARRSRYRSTSLNRAAVPALAAAALVIAVLAAGAFATSRVLTFLNVVTGSGAPGLGTIQRAVDPPAGSIAYKLKHGQRVNILLLGYGGEENDAPYLTDSMLVASLDPAARRVTLLSIPRDLWVHIDAFQDGRQAFEKINAAYDIGTRDADFKGKKAQYSGRDGGGHLAEHEVEMVTGLRFDKYAGMDFKAFRDIVNALGGVTVHMDGPLDDCHYPDYKDGYLNGGVPDDRPCPNATAGIHFRAGDYQVDGEQALQIARSRHASEADQATDFGRARRQQMLFAAIKRRAASAGTLTKIPQLMSALQKNFRTDMDVNDLRALYDWGGAIQDRDMTRAALTADDFLDGYFQNSASCGPYEAYVLCPEDPTYRTIRSYASAIVIDPKVLAERAPVQVGNATFSADDLGDRLTRALTAFAATPQAPQGFQLEPPLRLRGAQKTVVYDYSGGRYPATAAWLASFFGAQVIPAAGASPPPPAGQRSDGLLVVVGRDYGLRWYGQGP